MSLNLNHKLKTYYTSAEVSALLGESVSTLRHWETKFTYVKPRRTMAGVRQYTESDIEELRRVQGLVRQRGFTIEAAQRMLAKDRNTVDRKAQAIELLGNIRTELLALKRALTKIE